MQIIKILASIILGFFSWFLLAFLDPLGFEVEKDFNFFMYMFLWPVFSFVWYLLLKKIFITQKDAALPQKINWLVFVPVYLVSLYLVLKFNNEFLLKLFRSLPNGFLKRVSSYYFDDLFLIDALEAAVVSLLVWKLWSRFQKGSVLGSPK